MSAKTLIMAAAILAASTALTVPTFAAGGDGTGPAGNGPGMGPAANPPAAAQGLPVRAQVMFNLLDANHDGSVDKTEFAVISTATFDALDENHDGKLTPDELRGDFGRMFGGRGGPGGPGDRAGPGMRHDGGRNWDRDGRGGWGQGQGPGMGRMGGGPGWGAGNGPQGGPPNFASLDTNHDGVISQDEFNAGMPRPGQGYGPGPRR